MYTQSHFSPSETDLRNHFISGPSTQQSDAPPALYLRTTVEISKPIERATLSYAAFGIAEPWINGQRVNDDRFLPGWSDYRKRLYVVEEEVGHLLRPGPCAFGFILANGWAGTGFGPPGHARQLAETTALSARLHIIYKDGAEHHVLTSPEWRCARGPVRAQSLYHGEHYDAQQELADWTSHRLNLRRWKPVRPFHAPDVKLRSRKCPPVRVMATLPATRIWKRQGGGWMVDFGQNIVGVVQLAVREKPETCITLRFAEMLQADGSLYTENLRSARATDTYICAGGTETISPRWTFHGFRYVEISGLSTQPQDSDISALVLHNDLRLIGDFHTSHRLINRLQQCILWGQRGNFLEVPTDCPQRDERLGWSCDAQIFTQTACFNYDCETFYRQWMDAMRDGQREDGAFPDVAPDVLNQHGNAGWADAGVIVPYRVWKFYGRIEIVKENWLAMQSYLDFLLRRGQGYIQPETAYGDWLAVDATRPGWAATPNDLIGTAYFALVADIMAQMASALGLKQEAKTYSALYGNIRRAFQRRFVTLEGLVLGDTQTSYLCALAFNLMPAPLAKAAQERLVEKIKARDWHLSTGFLGTPLLNPVLSRLGLTDIAYTLLEQDTYPGWLYPLLNGATTMWERWNSWSHEHGFGPTEMNSFNHYAFGAIGEWLYSNVAGLQVESVSTSKPYAIIAPRPGGSIRDAAASIHTLRGKLSCGWKLGPRYFILKISAPEGVRICLSPPTSDWNSVILNGIPASKSTELEQLSNTDGGFASGILSHGKHELKIPRTEIVATLTSR